MNFRLIDCGWGWELDQALRTDGTRVRIICPFIKECAAERLLRHGRPTDLKVITRFDLDGFLQGSSDLEAIRILLAAGAQIRGVCNLHAKAYLINDRAIVTSANLTTYGLDRNHEFGFVSEDPAIVQKCREYFDTLWQKAGKTLTQSTLDEWDAEVTRALATGAGTRLFPKLGDYGAAVWYPEQDSSEVNWLTTAEQGFVKFFGEGKNRLERSATVLSEIQRAGCHWACSYPKRPRQPQDGALMFMGRLVKHSNDIVIFGRAIGMRHVEGRDEASETDLVERPWKVDWPYYIRVHDAEFIDGTLGDGISLNEVMETLGSDAFATTQRHAQQGEDGNTNPRLAIMQQPHVELTPQAIAWLNQRFGDRIDRLGAISRETLSKLDWPSIPE
jgi:hypothetical protein